MDRKTPDWLNNLWHAMHLDNKELSNYAKLCKDSNCDCVETPVKQAEDLTSFTCACRYVLLREEG